MCPYISLPDIGNHSSTASVCVFITAVPITKLFAWGEGGTREELDTSTQGAPVFLSFGNRTQNSRVAGARPNHQPIGGSDPNHQGICVASAVSILGLFCLYTRSLLPLPDIGKTASSDWMEKCAHVIRICVEIESLKSELTPASLVPVYHSLHYRRGRTVC
jgi:hypothetical protein